MKYDYSKLNARILEEFNSKNAFAKALGISRISLYKLLTNNTKFNQDKIVKWCDLLKIKEKDIKDYFFKIQV